MELKEYQIPEMEVVELKYHQPLLTTSEGNDSGNPDTPAWY